MVHGSRRVTEAAGRKLESTGLLLLAVLGIALSVPGEASQEPSARTAAETTEPQEASPSPARAFWAQLREEAVREIGLALQEVTTPDAQAASQALATTVERLGGDAYAPVPGILADLGDLDGDGVSELALQWTRLPREAIESGADGPLAWVLLFLAWDGGRWRPDPMLEGMEPLALQVRPVLGPQAQGIIALVFAGRSAIPFPVIFKVRDHAAELLWDSRATESRYTGRAQGRVEFKDLNGDGAAEMITVGRADPGVLVFPLQGPRGFKIREVYAWDGHAYVPRQVEYGANPDYTLYQFIAALRRRDFRTAYALTVPSAILPGQEPSLEAFREHVRRTWPEFLSNQIFVVPDSNSSVPESFEFELRLDNKVYVYRPTFSADSKYLLTGLERREKDRERETE
jgi:hypothetical protein